MDFTTISEIVAVLALLAASAFFSATETAFFSLDPLTLRRLAQRQPAASARVHAILTQPTRLLSTLLIGNTIVDVALAALGFALAVRAFPRFGESIAIVVVTVILVIFGDALPKRIGLLFAVQLAPLHALVITPLEWLFLPLRLLLERMTRALEPFFRPHGRTLSQEEFETVLDISNEEGILNADELAMIKAIIRLEDLRAGNVMTPRVDLIGLDLDEDPATFVARVRQSKRHFLLLYRGNLDNVEGFLDVRRFLLDPQHELTAARLPPFFVPQNSPLSQLLDQFKKRRIAVVVDEYGGTAGVVTRGDVLEEITGEIYNELNKPRPLFQAAGPHRWLVDANISLAEINRKLRLHLEAEGADRLAGWITAQAGHVPQQGDAVEAPGCRVTILQTLKQRVTLAQIEKLEALG
ncbi:MAG: HlyC/CorC family transporter [Verrucomicrobia bacterium]|nr:MAG: HlyC/CorC family transporter [Verrucomicrobiota bacterium]